MASMYDRLFEEKWLKPNEYIRSECGAKTEHPETSIH